MRSKSKELKETILKFAEDYYFRHHCSPSTSEIADAVGVARSTSYRYLSEMACEGMIDYENGEIMTSKIAKYSMDMNQTPVIGSVACGLPQLEEENIQEYVTLPVSLFGKGDFFILKANGESMIKAGINDGDLVVIDRTKEAHEGDIVVALVDHETTTLKRMFMDDEKKKVRLHPENDDMEDQYYDGIEIQGVAVHVIKQLQ